uniref:Uncharacterized protein n=1 Tax=Rhizophora mucronata TaxID=61149 RepID=A0A2P2MIM8_RHIMU
MQCRWRIIVGLLVARSWLQKTISYFAYNIILNGVRLITFLWSNCYFSIYDMASGYFHI